MSSYAFLVGVPQWAALVAAVAIVSRSEEHTSELQSQHLGGHVLADVLADIAGRVCLRLQRQRLALPIAGLLKETRKYSLQFLLLATQLR